MIGAFFGLVWGKICLINQGGNAPPCECLRKSLGSISKLSLDMYLCCYIFDALWYPIFKERWYENQGQFGVFFFAIVPLLFACS